LCPPADTMRRNQATLDAIRGGAIWLVCARLTLRATKFIIFYCCKEWRAECNTDVRTINPFVCALQVSDLNTKR
jgi:hypothetical protein